MNARIPFVPEFITVHLGEPDAPAENVTLPFAEYITNVASSEIFPTWPESAIRANMYAQISFALNRVYTEFYTFLHIFGFILPDAIQLANTDLHLMPPAT